MYFEIMHSSVFVLFFPFVMGLMARDLVDFMHDRWQQISQWCSSLRAMNDDERVITHMQCEQMRACIARARVSNNWRRELDEASAIIEMVADYGPR